MTADDESLTRSERRRRSDAAILKAAEQLFAEVGFERTTIRAVAARAGIDPALVMQHYGSKQGLFAAAARWTGDHQRILSATSDSFPRVALDDLLELFEGGDREAAVALLRNCLTHPGAGRQLRDEVLCERTAAVRALLVGPDAELRAELLGACLLGLGLTRYLLEVPAVAAAGHDDLHRLMEPVLRALVDPPSVQPPPAADQPPAQQD
ncbi:MAG TPA: TetR family transcriptional regulator [Mycobacteriales bacterium]|nr:TetR family transcriptional regulator [Mycobacteriales bacterium]